MFTESEQFFTSGGGYEIDQSIRFEPGDSPGLNRAWASGSRTTATFSAWFKLGLNDTTTRELATFGASSGVGNNYILIEQVGPSKLLQMYYYNSGVVWQKSFSQVLRDPSAWYHLVVTFDTTNGTAGDRVIPYLNGSRVTAFATSSNPTASAIQPFNVSGGSCYIGKEPTAASYFDGYIAEINFIDGTALDATSFGETNDDGVWVPIAYTGAYGTNGFYLTGATAADLGEDFSGNNNDFTSAGLATTDQMLDTPTVNYCTFNPLDDIVTGLTLSDGNLTAQWVSPNQYTIMGTMAPASGKFYWEYVMTAGGVAQYVGVMPSDRATRNVAYTVNATNGVGNQAVVYNFYNGNKLINGAATAYGASVASGVVVGVALNLDDQEVTFYRANVSQGAIALPVSGKDWAPAFGQGGDYNTNTVNFGATAFTYTPPTDFLSLNTANLPEPTIKDGSAYFNTLLWTGDGASPRSITGLDFTPDLIWGKARSTTYTHNVWDSVRGVSKMLRTDETNSEAVNGTAGADVTSFDSGGFTAAVGTANFSWLNWNAATYAAWFWKANGAGSSNTDGSITSTVSVDTTSGFSIVTYSGIRPTTGTVGHGLGVKPDMMIFKNRVSATTWYLWHKNLTNETTYALYLNTTAAQANVGTATWNNTAPTSSVFSLGNDSNVNNSTQAHVAYCFNSVEGYSKFGSYPGVSSADGAFISTGFKPAFVMVKNSTGAGNWLIWDSQRGPYNVMGAVLQPNTTSSEAAITAYPIDFLSNGFKHRQNHSHQNAGGNTYIYAAFAENPFGGANTSPATAR
jgi:hypothetical protein